MPIVNLNQTTVSQQLYQPLHQQLSQCQATRACPVLPDLDWLRLQNS